MPFRITVLATDASFRVIFDRHSIVDSVDGDQDRAVDALLAMTDPDHVPVQHTAANEPPSQVRHVTILLLHRF
jgi:hypothetical protein